MVQEFISAIKISYKGYLCSMFYVFLSIVYGYIFFGILNPKIDELKKVMEGLVGFSGIFSAILITFIISKIFRIRNEKRELKMNVIKLSNKVTYFRRICSIIIFEYKVWKKGVKSRLENEYKDLTYQHLYDQIQKNKLQELIDEFLKDENEGRVSAGTFYLALREMAKVNGRYVYGEVYQEDYIYSFDKLDIWCGLDCANAFFYYLEHKYSLYKDCILIRNLKINDQKEIEFLASRINSEKFKGRNFDESLLVDVGNYFFEEIFPKLRNDLAEFETSLPKVIEYTLLHLFFILIFGVFIPLFFPFFSYLILASISAFISTGVISLVFLDFCIKFRRMLIKEIDLKNSK